MAIHDEDLLLISDSQDGNESKKIKYSTLKSNINGDSGNDLQAVTDNGNTTTNGATFGAAIQVGNDPRNGTQTGTRLGTTTGLTASGDTATQYVVSLYNKGVSGRTAGIQASGAASFAGGAVEISAAGAISSNRTDGTRDCFTGELNGTATSQIKADGSASFAGDLTLNDGVSGTGRILFGDSQQVFIEGLDVGHGGSNAGITIGDTTNGANVTLRANGSATFANSVTISDPDITDNAAIGAAVHPGLIVVKRESTVGSDKYVFQGYKGTQSTSAITADGSASFAGDVETDAGIRAQYGVFNNTAGAGSVTLILQAADASWVRARGDKRFLIGGANTGPADSLIDLNGNDGSATFAEQVQTSKYFWSRNEGVPSSDNSTGGLYLYNNDAGSSGTRSDAAVVISPTAINEGNSIRLNYDGSASFAGTVVSSSSGATSANMALGGALVGDYGALQAIRPPGTADPSTADVFTGGVGGVQTTKIYADGSASFAGNKTIITDSGNVKTGDFDSDVGAYLGSAGTIAARIDGGGAANNCFTAYNGGTTTAFEVASIHADGSANFASNVTLAGDSAYLQILRTPPALNYAYVLIDAKADGDTKFKVDVTGSASFAGTVESNGPNRSFLAKRPDYTDGTTPQGNQFAIIDGIDADNKTTFRIAADGSIFGGSSGGQSVSHVASNYALNADGSATFAGDITANNVTFSATDGTKHNIRERIEEAISRLTAIETADLTDDQEHSALLTLIANMSSRITALEAQLAGGN